MLIAFLAHAETRGQPAPGFELEARDGKKVRLEEFRGRVVLLNFWATWCPPCREELPLLESLLRTYDDSVFVIVGINVDGEPGRLDRFLRRTSIDSLLILRDPKALAIGRYDPETMPATYIIDREGTVRYEHMGFSPDIVSEYDDTIRALLAESVQ